VADLVASAKSHQVRVHTTATPRLGSGVLFDGFPAGQPGACVPGLTDRSLGFEVNACADSMINDNLTVSLVSGGAHPGEVVRQVSGRTAHFALALLWLAYAS
jgi:hypothetical protein